MHPIETRAKAHDFTAFAAPDTMDAITDRIERLARAGRRATKVHRFIPGPGSDRDSGIYSLRTGLVLDTDARGEGVSVSEQDNPPGKGIHVMFKGVEAFGVSAYRSDCPDEATAAKRWHDKTQRRENLTLVKVTGWGEGKDDRIVITYYNDNGVGQETTIAFDRVETTEQDEADAAFLDRLAALADQHGPWDNDRLRAAAAALRYGYTLDEHAADPAKNSPPASYVP